MKLVIDGRYADIPYFTIDELHLMHLWWLRRQRRRKIKILEDTAQKHKTNRSHQDVRKDLFQDCVIAVKHNID